MATSTQTRDTRHRPPRSRRNTSSPDTTIPSAIDWRRYNEFRDGISAAELAARENLRLPTIQKSIDLVRGYVARYSQLSVETEVRRVNIDSLPAAANYLAEALTATMPIHKTVMKVRENLMTGEQEEYMDTETEWVPDHATRNKAYESMTKSLAAIQPKQPMVSVDARSQTNIANGSGGGQLAAGQALSFEAITRQIRAERGLSLGPGEPTAQAASQSTVAAPVEVDYELVEELAEEAADGELDESEMIEVNSGGEDGQ